MPRTHSTPASSSNFQLIFNNALKAYEKQTKKDLLAHPLAAELQSCASPASILTVLQQQVQDFNRSRSGNEKLTKWLDPTVNVLYAFSETLGEGVSLVFSPAKVIFAGVGVLLSAAKDVRASQDTLIDIFERIENFFRRLVNYTKIPPTPEMMDIIGKILVEVLSILAITTKEIKQGRTKKYMKRLIGRTDVEDALKRLDKLTDEEARMATAEVLRVTHAVAEDVGQVKRKQLWGNLHKWLSPPDPSTNHNIASSTHQKRTASWFFQGSIFAGWKSTNSLLWIHGKPGSGKSILCSTIIQDIEAMCEAGQASIAYFYFDFRDANKHGLHNLVPSLLSQLSASSDPRCDILSHLYLAHERDNKQPSDSILVQCLKQMFAVTLPDHRPVYLIMDAVDECPNNSGIPTPRERVLQLIQELVELHLSHLHICVTSRPEIDIQYVLDPLTSLKVSLHDQTGQKEDIAEYIRSVVYSDSEQIMKRWRAEDKELVIETLTERANGMFRWVFCQLDTLRHCLPSSIHRTLKELPESLDETYERVLRDIKKPNRDLAHRLLQCLVVAIRPLRVKELAEVLAIDFDDGEEAPNLNASWRWEDHEQALLLSCSSLIAIVKEDDHVAIVEEGDHVDIDRDDGDLRVVQFSHFSVKEFLTSPRLATASRDVSRYYIDLEPSHTVMAQACLSVLLLLDDRAEDGIGNSSSLAGYAAEHWVAHAQFQNVSSHVQSAMECLFDLDKPYFAVWLKLYDVDMDLETSPLYYFARTHKFDAGPLYYAALCGFKGLVEKHIIKYPHLVNATGGHYMTPALAALARRHLELARMLYRNGSSVDLQGIHQQSPLHSAARQGDSEIIQLLLDWKLDVNAKCSGGYASLHLALQDRPSSYFEIIRLLLEYGADPNSQASDGSTPLHVVSDSGTVEDSQMLLKYGANVEVVDTDGRTPFQVASGKGRDKITIFLSAYGTKDIS